MNTMPTESREITRQMWQTLMASKGASPTEITAEDHALYELSALAGYRRIRLVESASRLPGVLWFVLLIGGTVTVASTCMFGAANGALHVIQVSAFALLISLVLVAIADINRPFQGSVHVSDYRLPARANGYEGTIGTRLVKFVVSNISRKTSGYPNFLHAALDMNAWNPSASRKSGMAPEFGGRVSFKARWCADAMRWR